MTTRVTAIDLLDTVPGRIFIAGLVDDYLRAGGGDSRSAFLQSLSMVNLVRAATKNISSYLYGAGIDAALLVDPADANIVAMAVAAATELSAPSRDTFTSPQHHQGVIRPLRIPNVTNRRGSSEVLPDGAFWTSTPIGDYSTNSWTYSRETSTPAEIHELHFAPTQITVVRIDSATDWYTLLRSHTRAGSSSETMFPDWVSIAEHCDAVHLSLSGLLSAHPRLSEFAATHSSQNYAHSKMGTWAGVGDWSTVSTAWIRLPRHRRWAPIMQKPIDG